MGAKGRLRGVFGLLVTPYRPDYEINGADLARQARFCCETGQHGIVWPVMVGEFYFLSERERLQHLDVVLEAAADRLPVVFGCSAASLPETVRLAEGAQAAGADAVIAMAPPDADLAVAGETFKRMAEVFEGPLVLQNAAERLALSGEELARLVEAVPSLEYVKEERPPGPKHIEQITTLLGDKVTVFGGVGGRLLPEELSRGAEGCMPACEFADVLAKVAELWWAKDEAGARALHRRLLPLIVRETHPFMRHVLRCRGIVSETIGVQRGPGRWVPLDAGDRREIAVLAADLEGELGPYPFADPPFVP